jgi:hypothetical protein
MKRDQPLFAAVFALIVSFAVAPARAQVDCSDPDNLCTGDPCTIDEVGVLSPCVVDFGARDLVLSRTIKVPNDGVLSFTAENIEVNGKVVARHTAAAAGDGGDVSLIASNSIQLFKRIDVSGRATPGSVLLAAGGDVLLGAPIIASARGGSATAPGGTVTVVAQGSLTSSHRARIKVKGKDTPGGSVSLGAASVALDSGIDARGSVGGIALVAGSVGAVVLGDKIDVNGKSSVGGTITISGAADVTVDRLVVNGRSTGGVIDISGGAVDVRGVMQASAFGPNSNGGLISIAGQTVSIHTIRLRGRANGGVLTASSSVGNVEASGSIDLLSTDGTGGDVSLLAAFGVTLGSRVRASGATAGGTIDIESTGAWVTAGGHLDVSAESGAGGSVAITAFTDVILDDGAEASGTPGGTIVAHAGHDLLAIGAFEAQVGGCIALTADNLLWPLDDATFDPPLSLICP